MINPLLEITTRRWFDDHRPELKPKDKNFAIKTALQEVADFVKEMNLHAQILFTNQHLIQNYLKSSYNFIKDVFQEHNAKEFREYQLTPIFYEVNDEILTIAVEKGLVESHFAILNDRQFYDLETREAVTEIIDGIIS